MEKEDLLKSIKTLIKMHIDIHTPLWLWSRAGFPPLSDLEVLQSN